MRFVLVSCALAAFCAEAAAQQGQVRREGPWSIAAFHDQGRFQRCLMARAEGRAHVGFGVAKGIGSVHLVLFSDKWKLAPGTSYPVTLVAGQAVLEAQASSDGPTGVTIDVSRNEDFARSLARAGTLEIRTPATTLRVPLDRSGAALARLDACFAAESGTARNPFAAPGQAQASAVSPSNPFAAPAPAAPAAPAAPPPVAAPPPAPPVAAAPKPAADEAYAKLRADCEQDEDADLQIAGCTAVATSGREPREVQGIALANRGFGYLKKGDQARALASFDEAIGLYPAYPNARWGRGDIHLGRENWDAAIRDYAAALAADPKDTYVLQRRARAHLGKGDADAALKDAEEAVRLAPGEADGHVVKGEAHLRKGEFPPAAAAFDKALAISPGLAAAVEGRKKVEEARARGADAGERRLEHPMARAPGAAGEAARGGVWAAAGRAYAQTQYEVALSLAKGKDGPPDPKEAAAWFRRAAERGHLDAQNMLGVLYANGTGVERDRVEAMRWFRLAAAQGHAGAGQNLDRMDPDKSLARPRSRSGGADFAAREEVAGVPPALLGRWGENCERPNVGFAPKAIERLDIGREFPVERSAVQGDLVEVEYPGTSLAGAPGIVRETFAVEGDAIRWFGRTFPGGAANRKDPAVWRKCP